MHVRVRGAGMNTVELCPATSPTQARQCKQLLVKVILMT